MKNLFCHLAQKQIKPQRPFVKHVSGCQKCQEFFENVSSLESRLVIDPEEADERLCENILAQLASEKNAAPSPSKPQKSVFPIALSATVAVFILVLGVFTFFNPKESLKTSTPLVDTSPPTPLPVHTQLQPQPEITLAYSLEQQELLKRDLLSLGNHLQKNAILFRAERR